MIEFNLIQGLNKLIPGAKFRGKLKNQTEIEYNNIEQLDIREKPLYIDVYNATLSIMRRNISNMIDIKTDDLVEQTFVFNDGEVSHKIHLGIEEQINLDTMDRLRNELQSLGFISYPYKLKVSNNENGEGNYITLQNTDHFHQFFLLGLKHKNEMIASGRKLKDDLPNMKLTELINFIDTR